MQVPVLHIVGLTTIVRERTLPVSGTVLARLQQKVIATDVVAETRWAREHVLLDVARTLGVSPDTADRLIKCKLDERLPAGTEVAVGRGVFPRTVKVPRDGRVVAVGGGQVLLEVGEAKLELRAGIPGQVVEIVPDRGVRIRTTGGLVQGVWGNGRIGSGLLVNLMDKPDGALDPKRLDASLRGAILLAGHVTNPDVFSAAAEVQVRGLILSSIAPALLPKVRDLRYPVMATEGFGSMPMNSAAYKLLSTNAKREVTLNAEQFDRYTGARAEVIIPLPVSSEPEPPSETAALVPGLQVRMRRPPFMGMLGTIVSVKPGLTTLESGLRAPAAEVKIENNQTVIVPLINLEVVG